MSPFVHLPKPVATAQSWLHPPAECSERSLLTQLAGGSRSALAQLYLLYFQRLHIFFMQLTANPNLAEELIIDTMLDVWRKSETISSNISVFVWVMGIAYIHAYRRLASGTSTQPHLQPAPSVGLDSPGSSAVEMPPRLLDLIPRLTFEERAALHLVYCSNRSRQDLVHIMNIPSECVDMHLTNARRRLRSSAENAGDSTSNFEAPRSS